MSSPTRAATPARTPAWRRRLRSLRRHGLSQETRIGLGLTVLSAALTALIVVYPGTANDHPGPFYTVLMLPLLVASIFVGPRTLPWFVILLMLMLTYAVWSQDEVTHAMVGATGVQFAMGLIVLFTSFQRSRLGVAGLRGESMLVDLRDRIQTQARIPELPAGWTVQSALNSAGGTPFAGDFIVATRVPEPDRLEVMVVDVSGKGADAGTRALLLSGALGGLIGALRGEGFMAAANEYLLRQDWEEGFATAVHLSVDLTTGAFEVRTAGHPPAVRRSAAQGSWEALGSDGPVLGIVPGAEYTAATGVLEHGDVVMLYTDGMVEESDRDFEVGMEIMVGAAERLLDRRDGDLARRLVAALGSPDDDRALVVVRRR